MTNGPEQGPAADDSIVTFFRDQVRDLLATHQELTIAAARGRRVARILHLIDIHLQPGSPIDYHAVYMTIDTQTDRRSHGVYLANPWPRSRHTSRKESRHYFDAGQELIVREDERRGRRELEFLRGPANTADVPDTDMAIAILSLHNDLSRVMGSEPLKPMSLLFDKFVWAKP